MASTSKEVEELSRLVLALLRTNYGDKYSGIAWGIASDNTYAATGGFIAAVKPISSVVMSLLEECLGVTWDVNDISTSRNGELEHYTQFTVTIKEEAI